MEVKKKMNSQELRNLQEAYLEVVEGQQRNVNEIFGLGGKSAKDRLANSDYMKKKNKEADEKAIQNLRDMMSKDPERQKRPSRINNEQKDVYDIILSHLLDEGYAETPEAAKSIMVNMSEEWRDSIVEAMSSYDRNRKRAAQRAAARNAARDAGKTGVVPGVGYVTPRRERETYTDEKGTVRHKSGAKMP